jgi:hypothetical protein
VETMDQRRRMSVTGRLARNDHQLKAFSHGGE